jgi:undecaprenyl-diphosphatase
MLDALRAFDHGLFHKINAVWTCGFLDSVMPVLTDFHRIPLVRYGLIPAAAAVFVWRGRERALKALAGLVVVVGTSDLLAHRVIKPLVHRARPEAAGVGPILRENLHTGFSFPSNHAMNMFALAAFLGSLYPRAAIPLFLFAAIVGYSRPYVGVHFPLDVLGGALLGALIGWAGARLFKKVVDSRPPRPARRVRKENSYSK